MSPNRLPTTRLWTEDGTTAGATRRYRLLVTAGPDKGLTYELDEGLVTVGTHTESDIQLTDRTVSRYHLELELSERALRITDLNSTNGTLHGGTRLGSVKITGAAHLQVGKETIIALIPGDDAGELPRYRGDHFGPVLGASPQMQQLFAMLAQLAPTDATVLLEGETGTGKEAVAEAIHQHSRRTGGPYIIVDCGAIPRHLIQSELFGHVRGSFTGAATDKTGLVQAAHGGTLFLDEIGELSADLQPQLLRVLEKREFRRVGDTQPTPVEIRVIAATNRDLRSMVDAGTFREDLYFRLAVVRAVIPPLRERLDDLPLLARHFAAQLGRGELVLPSELIDQFRGYQWPGNVRELRNVVERAMSLGRVELPDHQAPVVQEPELPGGDEMLDLPFKEAKGRLVENFERVYLEHLLTNHRGNISRAAAEAGIDRNYIHRLIKKYGLSVERG